MSGYVRLYRTIVGHPAFRNDAEAMAFAWMVLKAAWKPATVRYKGHDIEIKRGELTVSIRDFADRMDRPKGWAERLFARLREHGMIEQKNRTQVGTQVGTHGGTVGGTPAQVITICNYDDYQADLQQVGTPNGTPLETGARQRPDTEQRREEEKEEEYDSEESFPISDFKPERVVALWNAMADRTGASRVMKFTTDRRRKVITRLKENTPEDFIEAINAIERSAFLRGGNNRGWWADFDWMLEPKNFTKLIEGTYDKQSSRSSGPDRPSNWAIAYDSGVP